MKKVIRNWYHHNVESWKAKHSFTAFTIEVVIGVMAILGTVAFLVMIMGGK